MKIGNVEIENGLILAPMAGVTDVGFRAVCALHGAGATVTEMVSVKGLYYNSKNTTCLLETTEHEKVKIVQLFGHEPEVFKQVICSPLLEKFDIIDINMGCPAPKIVNNGDGSALMKDILLAKEIVLACTQNTTKPVTVKFRAGWDMNSINAVEFAKMCESAGASAITIHARTKTQGYSGKANYDLIKQVVQAVKIPVIANGDVCNKETYCEILKTGCKGVMIGRGALGNPQLFCELQNLKPPISKLETILTHANLLKKHMGEHFTVLNMRKHYLWYMKGLENVADLKNQISREEDFEKATEIVHKLFKNC